MIKLSKITCLFLLVHFATSGCKTRHDMKVINQVRVPLIEGFETLKLDSSSWKTFDETRIYLHQGSEGYYNYIIFWPNGREFYSTFRQIEFLTTEDILTNKDGFAGYYQIINGEIIRESYAARTFLHDYYEIRSNGTIIWTQRQTRLPKRKRKFPPIRKEFRIYELFSISLADSTKLWKPFW